MGIRGATELKVCSLISPQPATVDIVLIPKGVVMKAVVVESFKKFPVLKEVENPVRARGRCS